MGDFTFNGVSASSLGLIVSGVNPFNSGKRKYDKYEIPGRSAPVLLPTGALENITIKYDVAIKLTAKPNGTMRTMAEQTQLLRTWLLAPEGYCTLTDTYNPWKLRLAYFDSDFDAEMLFLCETGKATLTFNCNPRLYNEIGFNTFFEAAQSENDAYPITNASENKSFPLYRCTFGGPEDSTLIIQRSSIASQRFGKITFLEEAASRDQQSVVYYDSELEEAYYENGRVANAAVVVEGDLTLPADTTRFIWQNSQNSVALRRREWSY